MSGLSALRRSGRFMVMVSSPESSFCRTISLLMRCCLCCLLLFAVVRCRPSVIASEAKQSIFRHCEPPGRRKAPPDDRLREAIHSATQRKNGLLRFTRNDVDGAAPYKAVVTREGG